MALLASHYMTRLVAALAFLSVLLPAPAFAVILAHDKSDADAIELGKRFEAAGTVIPDGGCTLIAPQWALTAAHVAHNLSAGSGKVRFGDREYAIDKIIIHPDGKMQPNRPPNVDMALLRLTESVEGVKPAALFRGDDEKDQTAYVVGSGDIGDGKSRPKRSDGKRRAATNTIDRTDDDRVFIKFDEPPGGTRLEGVGGPGDSGGPLLIENDNGIQIIGVSSGSMGKEGRYGLTDVYVRISTKIDWIEKTIR